jgi:hypothetical protein
VFVQLHLDDLVEAAIDGDERREKAAEARG